MTQLKDQARQKLLGIGQIEVNRAIENLKPDNEGKVDSNKAQEALKKVSGKQFSKGARKNTLTRSMMILDQMIEEEKLEEGELKKIINQGTTDHLIYATKKVTPGSSGIDEIVNESDSDKVGERNLKDGHKVPATFVLDRIRVEFADSTASNAGDASYSSVFDSGFTATGFSNGQLSISSGGRVIMNERLVSEFIEIGGTASPDGKADFVELEKPELLKQEDSLDVQFKPAPDGSGATDTAYMRVMLKGIGVPR